MNPDAIPDALADRDQWITWRVECRECGRRYDPKIKECDDCRDSDGDPVPATKKPVDADGPGLASSTDADTWASLETAIEYAEGHDVDGIGFVFASNGLLAGVDLDDCRDPETGEIDDWAREVVERLDSFTEVSPSGTGLHVYVLGFVPDGGNRADVGDGEIEVYDSGRYFTVTGDRLSETPATVEQRNDALGELHAEYIADDDGDDEAQGHDGGAVGGFDGTDRELIEKAKNAKNGDKFARLWRGDISGYPSHSEARQALANLLAFWTGGDEQRMLDLFRSSNLCRDADDIRTFENYETPTALQGRTEFYQPKASPDGGAAAASGGATVGTPDPTDYALDADAVRMVLGEDDDTPIGTIPNNRLANAIERILRERDVHLRLLDTVDSKNQPVYSMDGETKVWEEKGQQRIAKLCRKVLGHDNSKKVQRETLNALRASPSDKWLVERDRMGVDTGELAVQGGVLDLETRETRPARPEDYLQGRLPVEFDPEAEIDGTRFKEFLVESVDPQDVDKLQEYAGYTLLKGAQPYKKALFLVGPTDSGKGTFLKTLETILGDENVASETLESLVDSRWGTHSIYGKMANVSNEVSREGVRNVGQFKMLTGGEDKVTAEDKNVSKYQFTVTQKFLFATNDFPQVEDAGEAFFNRLLFVKFPHSVPDEEKEDLLGKFREERSAILNWMLDGLDRLRESGGMFTGERPIDDKREITKAYGSPVEQFAHAALDVTGDKDHVVHKKELYAAFTRYCDFIREETPTQTKFTRQLKGEAGLSDGKSERVDPDGNRRDVFMGAKLNEGLFKEIRADLPAHSYEVKDGGQQSLPDDDGT